MPGSGSGRLPGHGPRALLREHRRSPHGTSTCRSASHRPPPIAGVTTPRCPSIACTRESAWCTRSSVPAPKIAGSVVACRIHRRRFDPHLGDAAAKSLGILPQLPPHAVDDGCRIERPRMQPHPLAALAPVAGQLDPQLGADQVEGAEPGDERVGGEPHAERDLLGDLERRLEHDLAVQFGRRHAGLDGARIAARRERVQTDAALTEPLAHAVGLHRRELAERLHAEPGEESGELRIFERGDGQRSEEARRPARGHEEHGLGSASPRSAPPARP